MSIRTNLATNPRPASITGWLPYAGDGGAAATTTFPTTGGPINNGRYMRMTWTAAAASNAGNYSGGRVNSVVAGQAYTVSVYMRANTAPDLQLFIHWKNASNVDISTVGSASTGIPSNTWTRYSVVNAVAPAGAVALEIDVRRNSGGAAVGNTYDLSCYMVEQTSALGTYFDGATPAAGGVVYSWSGTADASTSIAASASITATADPANGRMILAIDPAATGTVYVFRRDPGFNATVRQSIEGVAVVAGTPVTLYDYEAQQGYPTDYLMTDVSGNVLATTNVTIPRWGTWLKSPTRPWLNVLTALGKVGDATRQLPREVVWIEGAKNATVLSEVRHGVGGQLTLSVRTADQLDALTELLDSGDTLMLDCSPDWHVPFRYINVGDTTEARLFDDLGLDKEFRSLILQGVLNASIPTGPLQLTDTGTYDDIPTTYSTYALIPATVARYDALPAAVA